MQLLLIRHALPEQSAVGAGADPRLSALGIEQATRIPDAVARFDIARVLSSTQSRAIQTAEGLAASTSCVVETDERLCEYDRDFDQYMTIETARTALPEMFALLKEGYLPPQVDEPAFRARVLAGIEDITSGSAHTDTVAVFAHGGVINMVLQDVLGIPKPLGFPIDYCSITRILFSRSGARSVAAVNETQHVWDLLPRNR